jgi:hypothetical protein
MIQSRLQLSQTTSTIKQPTHYEAEFEGKLKTTEAFSFSVKTGDRYNLNIKSSGIEIEFSFDRTCSHRDSSDSEDSSDSDSSDSDSEFSITGTFAIMTGKDATKVPDETSGAWLGVYNENEEDNDLSSVSRTLVGPIAMFIMSTHSVAVDTDGKDPETASLPRTTHDENISSFDLSPRNNLEGIHLVSRIKDIHRTYEESLDKLAKQMNSRAQQSRAILAILQGTPWSTLNLINYQSSDKYELSNSLTHELQAIDAEIAKFAGPQHQQKFTEDIIWFSVRGRSVCLLKSTILQVISNSQLAIRVSGDWTEQESTLDREGRIIIVSSYSIFSFHHGSICLTLLFF